MFISPLRFQYSWLLLWCFVGYADDASCPYHLDKTQDIQLVEHRDIWVDTSDKLCYQTIDWPKPRQQTSFWHLQAKYLTIKDSLALGEGIWITRDGIQINANHACIHFDDDHILKSAFLSHGVQLNNDQLLIRAKQGHLDTNNMISKWKDIDFYLRFLSEKDPIVLWGSAKDATINESHTELNNVQLTACPPDSMLWSVASDRVYWHENDNRLDVDKPVIYLGGVPVLTFPYMSFSQGRQTGFLSPLLGLDLSQSRQSYYGQPIYFNLARNQDLLLTAYINDQRGGRLDASYRLLFGTQRLLFATHWIYNDQMFASKIAKMNYDLSDPVETKLYNIQKKWSKTRYDLMFHYHNQLTKDWMLNMQWRKTRDAFFYDDYQEKMFPIRLPGFEDIVEQVKAEKFQFENFARLEGSYANASWLFETQRYHELMTLKRYYIDNLYSRFLNLTVSYPWTSAFHIQSNLTRFGFSSGIVQTTDNNPTGWRWLVLPEIKWSDAPFLLRSKLYGKHYYTSLGGQHKSQTKVIPSFVLELQSNKQEDIRWNIDYHYIPMIKQNNLPEFDVSLKRFEFDTLHDDNRFKGYDRIGDTSHVNIELDYQWDQWLEFRLGQRLALRKNRQCLDINCEGDWLAKHHVSPSLIGAKYRGYPNVEVNMSAAYHVPIQSWLHRTIGLDYQRDRFGLMVDYKVEKDALTDDLLLHKTSSYKERLWRVQSHWDIGRHWNVSIAYKRKLLSERFGEYQAKVRYNHCCWSIEALVGASKEGDVQTKQAFKNHYYELRLNIPQFFDTLKNQT